MADGFNTAGGGPRYLVPWGIYIDGARDMLLRLRDLDLLAEKKPGKSSAPRDKDRMIYSKAVIDMLLDSKDNCDRLLSNDYDDIRYTDHVRDSKGRLVKCRAYFARRTTGFVELK